MVLTYRGRPVPPLIFIHLRDVRQAYRVEHVRHHLPICGKGQRQATNATQGRIGEVVIDVPFYHSL